jgi:hypothetical protein
MDDGSSNNGNGLIYIYQTNNGIFAATAEHQCLLIPPNYPIRSEHHRDFSLASMVDKDIRSKAPNERFAINDRITPLPKPATKGYMNDYKPSDSSTIEQIFEIPTDEFPGIVEQWKMEREQHDKKIQAVQENYSERMSELKRQAQQNLAAMRKEAPTLIDFIKSSVTSS